MTNQSEIETEDEDESFKCKNLIDQGTIIFKK